MKASAWWRRFHDWRQRNVSRLKCDDAAFAVVNYRTRAERSWRDLTPATAFKRDLLTVDLLCLLLDTAQGPIEVDRAMYGYPAFEDRMRLALGIDIDAKLSVLVPAFTTNATAIFDRATPPV